uniref:Uncharacterized protein n=1 Tax=Bracon brevicornis TaxID=1563983 RepID=A0A6V7KRW0_9HYME
MKRSWDVNGDTLEQIIHMATSTTPELTEHLRAQYKKCSDES